MIIHSHVQRGLVGSEYNTRRRQCETAAPTSVSKPCAT